MQSQPTQHVGFLEESPGHHSSMRLMCLISLFAAIGFGIVTVQRDLKGDALYITYGFLIGAFAPKAVQKFAEVKLPVYAPPPPPQQMVPIAQQPVQAYPATMMVATPNPPNVTPPAQVSNQEMLARLQARGR